MNETLLHVLVALIAVLVTGRLLARLFAYLGQPPVIGEVMAGILLGPSLLGSELSGRILPPDVGPYLAVLAQLGVILYMFHVGLELNLGHLQARAGATIAIAQASIVVPFLLGLALAWWLYPLLSSERVSFVSFALFVAVAMSITAFPVLARILEDRGLTRSDLGLLALGCAAINDAAAWCLLAIVAGVAQARVGDAAAVIGWSLLFVLVVMVVVRPLAIRLARRWEERCVDPGILGWLLALVLLSALATEWIGIHAIFGAFLLGAVIPHDSRLAREVSHKLHDVVTILLLPAFFAYTGMRTEIGLVSGWDQWLWCGVIMVVATAGKFGGTLAAARLTGLPLRTSAALGVLMNTRGLMELIVLNVGLDLGVISPTLFAMLVLMALVATLLTTPALQLLRWAPNGCPGPSASAGSAATADGPGSTAPPGAYSAPARARP
jgi:Kef-type K+ transport system membrane component KefB